MPSSQLPLEIFEVGDAYFLRVESHVGRTPRIRERKSPEQPSCLRLPPSSSATRMRYCRCSRSSNENSSSMALMARHSSSCRRISRHLRACFFFSACFEVQVGASRPAPSATTVRRKPGTPARASRAEAKTSRRLRDEETQTEDALVTVRAFFWPRVYPVTDSHDTPFFCEQGRRPPQTAIPGGAPPKGHT